MKQLRRLAVEPPQDRYQRAQRALLRSVTLSEAEFRALERERPDHIVEQDGALLIAQPRGYLIDLHYAFPNRDAFPRLFPDLLRRLVDVVRTDEGPLGFRIRLTDAPSRPYVEPVLAAHAFEAVREWIEMLLDPLPAARAPKDEVAPGFSLRPARPGDADAIAAIDQASFPASWLTPDAARSVIGASPVLHMLEGHPAGAVGFLRLRTAGENTGYIADVAVHPEFQRRGLGEAMVRWALAWFRSQGVVRAALTVSTENGRAIALYRKLGFLPGEAGIDYRRPVDEEEVRQVLERHRAAHIRVRRRY